MAATEHKTTLTERRAFDTGQLFLLQVDDDWIVVGESLEKGQAGPLDWSWINPNVPSVLCRSCPRILPVTCFRGGAQSLRRTTEKTTRHPDCVVCEYLTDEAYKREHCWEARAERALRDHMRRERDQGLHACETLEEYMRLTGVTIEWLARKMRLAWESNDTCDHCETAGLPAHWQEIVSMPTRDLSRMTIDRTDPYRLLARDNLTLMCWSGNNAKAKTDPATYNDRQAYWRLHNHSSGAATMAGASTA